MSDHVIKILIAGALLLHGLAHGRAFIALVIDALRSQSEPAVPVSSWLLPSLSTRATAGIASPFWLLSTLGFIGAALAFWGTIIPGELWRTLAVSSSIISSAGMVLFSGIWPGAPDRRLSNVDTVIAAVMNAAILVLLLVFGWPPASMFGI
jgi:hypothetical protein